MNGSMRIFVTSCLVLFVFAQPAFAQNDPRELHPECVRWYAADSRGNSDGSKNSEDTAVDSRAELEAKKKAWIRYTILLGVPVNT